MLHNKTHLASIAALVAYALASTAIPPKRRYEPVLQSAEDASEALAKAEFKRDRKQAKALKSSTAYSSTQGIKNGNS